MNGIGSEAPHEDEDITVFSVGEEMLPLLEPVALVDEDHNSDNDSFEEEDSDSEADIDPETGSGSSTPVAVSIQATSTLARPLTPTVTRSSLTSTTSQAQQRVPSISLTTMSHDPVTFPHQPVRQPRQRQRQPENAEVSEAHYLEGFSDPHPTDADDSIVLSDLVRTGEASRLRRRGAVAVRERERPYVPPVQALFNVSPEYIHINSSEDSTRATWTVPGLVDRTSDPSEEYTYILFCGNVHSATSSLKGKEKAHGTQDWGCGALIHTHVSPRPLSRSTLSEPHSALPRRRPYGPDPGQSQGSGQGETEGRPSRGVWTARTECLEGAVARLEAQYFAKAEHDEEDFASEPSQLTPSEQNVRRTDMEVRADMEGARRRFTHMNPGGRSGASDCGCVREGIGCAVCGNPLGTRYIPCRVAAESYVRPRIERSQYLAQLRASEVGNMINAPEGRAYWGSLVGDLAPEPFPPRSFLTSSSSPSSIRDPSASTSTPGPSTSTAHGEQDRLILYTFFSDPVTSSNPVYDFELGQQLASTAAVPAPTPQNPTFSEAQGLLGTAPVRALPEPPSRASWLESIRQSPISLIRERVSQSPDVSVDAASQSFTPAPSGDITIREHVILPPQPPPTESAAAGNQLTVTTGPTPRSSLVVAEPETSSEAERWTSVRSAARERVRARARARGAEQEALDQAQASGQEDEAEVDEQEGVSASSSLPALSGSTLTPTTLESGSTIASVPTVGLAIVTGADTDTSMDFEDIPMSETSSVRTASPRRQTPRLISEESDILLPPSQVMGTMSLLPTPPSGPSPLPDNSGDTHFVRRATVGHEDGQTIDRSGGWTDDTLFHPGHAEEVSAFFTDEEEDDFIVAGGPHSAPLHPRRRRRANVLRRGQRQRFDPDGEDLSNISGSDGEDGNDDHVTFSDPAYANRYRETGMRLESILVGPSTQSSSDSESDDDQTMYTSGLAASNNDSHENTNETNIGVGDPARASLAGGDYGAENSLTIRGRQVLAREVESRALAPGESLPPLHTFFHRGPVAARGRGVGRPLRTSRSFTELLGTDSGTEQAEEYLRQLRSQLANIREMNSQLADVGRAWTGEQIEGRTGGGLGGGGESLVGVTAGGGAGGEGIMAAEGSGLQATREMRELALRRTQDFLQNNNAEESLASINRIMQSVVTSIEASGNGEFITAEMRNAVAITTSQANSVSTSLETMRELTGINAQIMDITDRLAARQAQDGGAGEVGGRNRDDRWELQREETRRQFGSMNQQLDEIRVQLLEGRNGEVENAAGPSPVDSLREIRSRLTDMMGLLSARHGIGGADAGGAEAAAAAAGDNLPETLRDQMATPTSTSARSENSTSSPTSRPGSDAIPALHPRLGTALGDFVIPNLDLIHPALYDAPYVVSSVRMRVPNRGGVDEMANERTGVLREAEDEVDADMAGVEVGRGVGESSSPRVRAPLRRPTIHPSRDSNSMDVDEDDDSGTSVSGPIVGLPESMVISVPPSGSSPSISRPNTIANANPSATQPSDISPTPRREVSPGPRGNWYGHTAFSNAYVQRTVEQQAERRQSQPHGAQLQMLQGVLANADAIASRSQVLAREREREQERRDNANLRMRASARAVLRARAGLLDPDGERFVYDERHGIEGDEVEPGLDLDGVRHEETEGSRERGQQRIREVWESIVFRDR